MERSNLLLLGLIGLVIFFASQQSSPTPTPGPVPGPPAVDLLTPFRANPNTSQAKEHAEAFGALCKSLAEGIEFDSRKTEPRIKTGVQMDDLRITTREQQMRGWSFAQTYPTLGSTIDQFMQGQVGTNGGPLDAAQKQQWIAAFRTLSDAAFYAANQL